MALIGSDFVSVVQKRKTRCSECHADIPVGAIALESIKDGKCKKRVCSEKCRLDFDDAFWQSVAFKDKRQCCVSANERSRADGEECGMTDKVVV
jgi:uncharacterized Fe-S center protein